jgi:hypothetical protein
MTLLSITSTLCATLYRRSSSRTVVRQSANDLGGPVIEKFSILFPRVKPSFTGPPCQTVMTVATYELLLFVIREIVYLCIYRNLPKLNFWLN